MQRTSLVKSQKLVVNGARKRIGISVAEFNPDVTKKLLAGALKELRACGVRKENITVVRVPGSFELPLVCQRLAKTGHFDGLIALGCVIKGETDHYYYIAAEAAAGIMEVMLKHNIPIGFGVLTTDTLKQAQARASGKPFDTAQGKGNKGAEAARAALETLLALEKVD